MMGNTFCVHIRTRRVLVSRTDIMGGPQTSGGEHKDSQPPRGAFGGSIGVVCGAWLSQCSRVVPSLQFYEWDSGRFAQKSIWHTNWLPHGTGGRGAAYAHSRTKQHVLCFNHTLCPPVPLRYAPKVLAASSVMPAAHFLRYLTAFALSAAHNSSGGLFSRRRLSVAFVALRAPAAAGLRLAT